MLWKRRAQAWWKIFIVNVFGRGNIQRCQRGKLKIYHKFIFKFVCQIWCTHKGKQKDFAFKRKSVVNIFIWIFNIANCWALMKRSGHTVVHAMLQQRKEYKVRYFCVSFECFTLPRGKCPKRMEFCGWIIHKYCVSIIIFIYFYYTRHWAVLTDVFMGLSSNEAWFHF